MVQAAQNTNGSSALERQEFGARELTRGAEMQAKAMAVQARAAIEARYIMAMQRPRDPAHVRAVMLKRCEHPGFAEEAWYELPTRDENGEPIQGPSIRFAEEAARLWGNLSVQVFAIYDDPDYRVVRVSVTDLESNIVEERDVTVRKAVERSSDKGRTVLSTRLNSRGKVVYLVAATDDEIAGKENAIISKSKRNAILGLLPADLVGEAKEAIRRTRENESAVDPDRKRKELADWFFQKLGISPADLAEYLGHSIDKATPPEMRQLHGIGVAISEGRVSWDNALAQRREEQAERDGAKGAAEERRTAAQKAAEKVRAQGAEVVARAKTDSANGVATPVPSTGLKLGDFWREAKALGANAYAAKELVGREFEGREAKDLTDEQRAEALELLRREIGEAS